MSHKDIAQTIAQRHRTKTEKTDAEHISIRGAHMYIRGDHAELVVEGRLDVRSAADARTVLHSAVDDGAGDLVLDLTGLDSWDATGLGVIMGAHRRAGRCGRRLVLRGVPAQMQRLLVATRLHRILAIEGGIEAESLPRV